ncbi:MAG: hypothetical protein ACR2GR_04435 [Rhodothermales bacterium]
MRTCTTVLFAGLLVLLGDQTSAAQPLGFGSADDPREQIPRSLFQDAWRLNLMTGPSLIASRLRGAGAFGLDVATDRLTARIGGTLRAFYGSTYNPDLDEPYDLVRLLTFARYQRSPRSRLYLRAGPTDRMRLGTGHVVNFFSTTASWDDRTVETEAMWRNLFLDVAAFSDNVFFDGVVGGRVALRPFASVRDQRAREIELGFNYATDLSEAAAQPSRLEAYNVDLRFTAMNPGDFDLAPYLSYAWLPRFGRSFGAGVSLESYNFIDIGRFRLRLGLHRNTDQFVSGYIGSFYTVNGPGARILDSDEFLATSSSESFVGLPLDSIRAGTDLITELRILFFERFELWYFFQRHFGAQALSQYHFRLFFHATDQLLLDLSLDRGGLESFFSLFEALNDETALLFNADYHLAEPFWIFLRARYSYERIREMPDGTRRYLVQRRFEPMAGVRFSF